MSLDAHGNPLVLDSIMNKARLFSITSAAGSTLGDVMVEGYWLNVRDILRIGDKVEVMCADTKWWALLIVKSVTATGALVADLLYADLDPPAPCLLYTSPSPRDRTRSRMPSSA